MHLKEALGHKGPLLALALHINVLLLDHKIQLMFMFCLKDRSAWIFFDDQNMHWHKHSQIYTFHQNTLYN